MIDLKNIEIGYHNELFHVNELILKNGFLYTLLGKNGSGKTTFFQTLLKQIHLFNGEISLNNKTLAEIKQNELAHLITFVSSKFEGIQHLTVYDYISLGRMPHTNFLGKLSSKDHEIVDNIIQKLELFDLKNKDTSKISDGEKQFCSIAKALVQKTKIILLDEPSAFLDYSNRIKILKVLKTLAHEMNLCIIQSSHDLELSLEFSDYFLVINSKKSVLNLFNNFDISKEKIIFEAYGIK